TLQRSRALLVGFRRWGVLGWPAEELDRAAGNVRHLFFPLGRPARKAYGVVGDGPDRHRREEDGKDEIPRPTITEEEQQRRNEEEHSQRDHRRRIALPGPHAQPVAR